MKKILFSILAITLATFSFTSCEDVPAPYDDPNQGGNDEPSIVIEPTGDGTLDNPFNVAAAIEYTSALEADVEADKDIYIKGKITQIRENFDNGFGNATYYISDDENGTNEFYVYRSLYLGNKKYTSGDLLQVGDEVIICGKVINYMGNTPETVTNKSYLYSLNGNTGDGQPSTGEAKGDGTLENPFNSVAANQYASSLGADEVSDKDVYIKGIISSIKENFTTQYGNASFYISEDGKAENEFYVYRTLYLGNVKYTEGALPQVGDEVIICGKVTNYYGNTPETMQNQSYIYSLKSNNEGSDDEQPSGDTGDLTAANGNFETWVSGLPNNWSTTSTAGNATLSMSTDAHSGSYSVKVGGDSKSNKRISYKEMELKAGEYTMTFYAKAATATGASVRPGYVPVTDGKVGNYFYGDYTNDITNSEWVKVTHTFTIDADGTYCVLIMNSKNPGGDVLIDDFTLSMGETVIIK